MVYYLFYQIFVNILTIDGQERLKRVLMAYSYRNPLVGYCQSMNIITAGFLEINFLYNYYL